MEYFCGGTRDFGKLQSESVTVNRDRITTSIIRIIKIILVVVVMVPAACL